MILSATGLRHRLADLCVNVFKFQVAPHDPMPPVFLVAALLYPSRTHLSLNNIGSRIATINCSPGSAQVTNDSNFIITDMIILFDFASESLTLSL